MPIYEFECQTCHERIETLLKSAADKICCPKCGGEKLVRLLSTFSAQGGAKEAAHGAGGCSCCPSSPSCPRAVR